MLPPISNTIGQKIFDWTVGHGSSLRHRIRHIRRNIMGATRKRHEKTTHPSAALIASNCESSTFA